MDPVKLYKCFADDIRLRTLLLLEQQGELCVCELTAALGEPQPKVSRHLAQLRECGLLRTTKRGKWVYYQMNSQLPQWVKTVIRETATSNQAYMDMNLKALNAMGDRPGRTDSPC